MSPSSDRSASPESERHAQATFYQALIDDTAALVSRTTEPGATLALFRTVSYFASRLADILTAPDTAVRAAPTMGVPGVALDGQPSAGAAVQWGTPRGHVGDVLRVPVLQGTAPGRVQLQALVVDRVRTAGEDRYYLLRDRDGEAIWLREARLTRLQERYRAAVAGRS